MARSLEGDDAVRALWTVEGRDAVLAVAAHRSDEGRPGRWSVEIAVHPEFRSEAYEAEAVRRGTAILPSGARHSVWASRGGQVRALAGAGYRETRSVIRMERSLPTAEREPPAGLRLETFRWERDAASVVDINNRAFVDHREQANLDERTLAERTSLAWFEAEGLLMAYRSSVAVGFCWTKVEEGAVGEIYVVAVDPAHQGRGLGRWLTLAGLDHLSRRRGSTTGMLWVDGLNVPARSLYESLGFEAVRVNREFEPGAQDQPKR